jgi:hypothetical protein
VGQIVNGTKKLVTQITRPAAAAVAAAAAVIVAIAVAAAGANE